MRQDRYLGVADRVTYMNWTYIILREGLAALKIAIKEDDEWSSFYYNISRRDMRRK